MANEEIQQVMRPARIPTDKVLHMRSQGLSNNQIIQTLQREGIELPLIFNAMNQADIRSGIDYGNLGGSTMAEQQSQGQFGQEQQDFPAAPAFPGQETQQDTGEYPPSEAYPDMGQSMGPPQPMDFGGSLNQQPMMGQAPMGLSSYPGRSGYDTQRIEELAEAIIDEKWNEIVRSINKIIDWKERVESRVTKMEQQMDDLQKNFDRLHNGVLGKITDYDQNLQNVGAEIKAMDRVFQKVLPTLTENVSELSSIAKRLKK